MAESTAAHAKETAAYARVIARAWREPAFKALLLTDPHRALAEAGHPVPPGMTFTVVENTAQLVHFILPADPGQTELSEEVLKKAGEGNVCPLIVNVGPQP
jgi:hypothetical protein